MKTGETKTSESSTGFSVLELVVALAIAAILAAFAVPSYQASVARGYRIDAVIALHRAAQAIAAAGVAGPAARGAAFALPPGLSRVPDHGRIVYRLEWSPAADSRGGYELRAIPAADGPMRADACGTFVLDALGGRSNLDPVAGEARIERCWSGRAT